MKRATPASDGVAIGAARFVKSKKTANISHDFKEPFFSLKESFDKLSKKLKNQISNSQNDSELTILEAHLEILNDPSLFEDINTLLKEKKQKEYEVIEFVFNKWSDIFSNSGNDYLAQRVGDLQELSKC